MPNDEPPREADRPAGRRRRRGGRPKEDPRPGDLEPQPQDRWGELYSVYKLYDRHGTLLYVGVTDDVVRQLTEHQQGTRLQWGGRLDDRSRWWAEVVHVTVEHLPAGTTEWEAKLYCRTQLALGPRYNTEGEGGSEAARAARLEAEQRDAELHDRARQLHARHDGVTRLVRPTVSIVPRFPNSAPQPAPAVTPPVTAPTPTPSPTGAHDARRRPDTGLPQREPALVGSGPGPAGPETSLSGGVAPAERGSSGGSVAIATRPAPAAAAPSPSPATTPDVVVDHSLDHQGRYLLLTMAGVFLGIVLLSLNQVLR